MTEENGVTQVTPPVTEPQEVNVNESEVVEQATETQAEEVDVSQIDPSFPVAGAGKTPVEDELDEKGVPYKNRFHEYKRKFEDTSTQLNEIKSMVETLAKSQEPKEEPEPTIEDLEAFKQQHPEHAAYVEAKKLEIIQKKAIEAVRQEFTQVDQKRQAELIKQESLRAVAMNFPDAFERDERGNVTGWDLNNPITQRIMQYGQDPNIANRPDGLLFAAKLAAGDMYADGLIKSKTVIAQQKAQVGDLKRKTAIEGNNNSPVAMSATQAALNDLRSTGSSDAARSILRNLFVQPE